MTVERDGASLNDGRTEAQGVGCLLLVPPEKKDGHWDFVIQNGLYLCHTHIVAIATFKNA